jgi:hypothetical protein
MQIFKFDKANRKKLWQDAMTKEIENIQSCKAFKDMGKAVLIDGKKKKHCPFYLRRKA